MLERQPGQRHAWLQGGVDQRTLGLWIVPPPAVTPHADHRELQL
jgi:hypothetical protein